MDPRTKGFNPETYPDLPLCNIQAVAEATGVPAITLRSWERRYGVPQPKRDTKGYRLYSERDIAITRWLTDRLKQGVGISRAVTMLRALLSGQLGMPVAYLFDFDSLRERLLEAIIDLDDVTISRVMGEAFMVAPVEEVALRVVQPALYDIGERWAGGELSVTTEHVGSNFLRSQLTQLVRLSPPPHRSTRLIVGCAPGELHDIGALMVALFLRRRGFDVIYAGASVEPDSLTHDAAALHPVGVCLSASSAETASTLAALFERLGEGFRGILGFGGQVFNMQPELVERVPGLFLGTDAADATSKLEQAVSQYQREK